MENTLSLDEVCVALATYDLAVFDLIDAGLLTITPDGVPALQVEALLGALASGRG